MRSTSKEYRLLDSDGQEWARATLSPSRLSAILKGYARAGLTLTSEEVSA